MMADDNYFHATSLFRILLPPYSARDLLPKVVASTQLLEKVVTGPSSITWRKKVLAMRLDRHPCFYWTLVHSTKMALRMLLAQSTSEIHHWSIKRWNVPFAEYGDSKNIPRKYCLRASSWGRSMPNHLNHVQKSNIWPVDSSYVHLTRGKVSPLLGFPLRASKQAFQLRSVVLVCMGYHHVSGDNWVQSLPNS